MSAIKPKAMVALMYSSGLRIGEVCNLRYEDIQRKKLRLLLKHPCAVNHLCHLAFFNSAPKLLHLVCQFLLL